ncbi:hypothetical protein ADK58_12765 [Streptomyces sp. XY152]|nr:hypothetical protein ADK58_12765 [Streptomyces sp. XY152]
MTTGGGQGVPRILDHPGSDEEGHHPASLREGEGLAAAGHPADQLLEPEGGFADRRRDHARTVPRGRTVRAARSARIQLFR